MRAVRLSLAVLAVLFALCSGKCTTPGTHSDLPNPPSNEQTIPAGSWLIPMDENQYINGAFNLKAYGFAIRLIWADEPLEWYITACKEAEDPDIKDLKVRQILPSWSATPKSMSFKYGALVLRSNDYQNSPGVALMVYQELLRTLKAPVVVYHVEGEATAELRHSWIYRPKIGLLGTENPDIHRRIFDAAGLVEGQHWDAPGLDVEALLDQDSCYTFISNPHDSLKDGATRAVAAHKFVSAGGNFMAQCHGVRSYGVQARSEGKQLLLDSTIPDGSQLTKSRLAHPDLAYVQMEHAKGFSFAQGGSWKAGSQPLAKGKFDPNTAYLELLDGTTSFKAMAGTITGYPVKRKGGMIFYLGGHSYKKDKVGDLNGMRMLLNAALVPAGDRNGRCGLDISGSSRRRTLLSEPENEPAVQHDRALLADGGDIPTCKNGKSPSKCDYAAVCSEAPSCLSGGAKAGGAAGCTDNDQCLASKAGWKGYTCASSREWCSSYAADMACCPQTCGKCAGQTSGLTCFPWYCGDCRAVWMEQFSGQVLTCDGDTKKDTTLPPVDNMTPPPTPKYDYGTLRPTFAPHVKADMGDTSRPTPKASPPPGSDVVVIDGLNPYPGTTGSKINAKVTMKFFGTSVTMDYENIPACTVTDKPNSCGLHIHAERSCAQADWVEGHFYSKPGDPWKEVGQTSSTGGTGTFTLDYGDTQLSTMGRSFVLHGGDGARLTCDLIVRGGGGDPTGGGGDPTGGGGGKDEAEDEADAASSTGLGGAVMAVIAAGVFAAL